MIRLKLSEGGKATIVLTFDGEVLEIFSSMYAVKYNRIHISHIESIEINTDRKEQHKLVTKLAYGFFLPEFPVEEGQVGKVNALIAEVQAAKAAFSFE